MVFFGEQRLAKLQAHKRELIIGGIFFIIVVGVVSYGVWSYQVWAKYEPSYTQWRQSVKTDVDRATALPVSTPKEREAALEAYSVAMKRIDTTSLTICVVPAPVAWQVQVIDSVQAAASDCRATVDGVIRFKDVLQKVTNYLQDDVAVAAIITTIPQPTELDDDRWSQQTVAWSTVISTTTDLKVSESFQPTKTLVITKMTAIRSAWQAVIAASDAKDKTKYLDAQKTLAAAYDGLNEVIMTDSSDTLQALLRPLPDTYQKAFPGTA